MASWSIDSCVANAEGSHLILSVTVTGTSAEIPVNPDPDASSGNTARIDEISAWRFHPGSGVVQEFSDNEAEGITIYDLTRSGAGPVTLTFKASVVLPNERTFATNANAQSPTFDWLGVSGPDGLFKIAFNGSGTTLVGPTSAGSEPIDATTVGRLSSAASAELALNSSAQAEMVERDGGTGHLDTWENLGTGGDPVGGPADEEPELVAPSSVPAVDFDASDEAQFTLASPPQLSTTGTIAAVILPGTSDNQAAHHIIGRANATETKSWQLRWKGTATTGLIYETWDGSTGTAVTMPLTAPTTPALVVLRRRPDGDVVEFNAWINGIPVTPSGEPHTDVNAGTGDVTIGARIINGSGDWGEAFDHHIDEVALYGEWVDDLALSLLHHQIARRSRIELGYPIPEEYDEQPFTGDRELGNRPIAVMNLSSGGSYYNNYWGQNLNWRGASQAAIEAFLKSQIRCMINACDQFEIMFNRPGGKLAQDIVPTYVFGSHATHGAQITTDQWNAMSAVWTAFGLESDLSGERRAWFYTGSGLPLDDAGELLEDGTMGNRVIAPITPACYVTNILNEWTAKDERFQAFFLDAASHWYAKFVELCHSGEVDEGGFTLVGEAIPLDPDARAAAPFYSIVGFGSGPWWINDNRQSGYDTSWSVQDNEVIYFAVLNDDEYPYMYEPPDPPLSANPGQGSNLSISNIYRFITKGATPVAWQNEAIFRRVGSAWNYAKGRVAVSRHTPSPRIMRVPWV